MMGILLQSIVVSEDDVFYIWPHDSSRLAGSSTPENTPPTESHEEFEYAPPRHDAIADVSKIGHLYTSTIYPIPGALEAIRRDTLGTGLGLTRPGRPS
jgi:hypothetical protein